MNHCGVVTCAITFDYRYYGFRRQTIVLKWNVNGSNEVLNWLKKSRWFVRVYFFLVIMALDFSATCDPILIMIFSLLGYDTYPVERTHHCNDSCRYYRRITTFINEFVQTNFKIAAQRCHYSELILFQPIFHPNVKKRHRSKGVYFINKS